LNFNHVTRFQAPTAPRSTNTSGLTTVGVDVGGPRKGSHAIALSGGAYAAQLATSDAEAIAHWCRSIVQASVIAIDGPCRWSRDGRARPCERELRHQGIICFAPPTRRAAIAHPADYFG
jgi:predicted nuclease with RNAse H fold